jgi:AcrR family transcriptional regulator
MAIHPTKAILIETVVKLLDQYTPASISSEEVLKLSGVSKGSMYHHFEDFNDLLEDAQIVRFASYVDSSIKLLTRQMLSSKTSEDLLKSLEYATEVTQSPNLSAYRAERIRAFAEASRSPRMAKKLSVEQERLTQALADLWRECQERGLFNKEIDPRAGAVLIQAYSLGKIVDDFAVDQMDPLAWNNLIDRLVRGAFGA